VTITVKTLLLAAGLAVLATYPATARAGIADSPVPALQGQTAVDLFSVAGVTTAGGLGTYFSCTNKSPIAALVSVEVFGEEGGAPCNDASAVSVSVAPGASVMFATQDVNSAFFSAHLLTSVPVYLGVGSARILSTVKKKKGLLCTAFVADASTAPPTSMAPLNVVGRIGPQPPTQIATKTPTPTPTSTPGRCGDDVVNTLDEECDGADDSACPGQCGSPASAFPCLCLTIARERVIEHANADLDRGWTGRSHDAHVVEGGGYVADLYDCDGPGGPDSTCTVGPSCSAAPHSSCATDAQCALLTQGTCRKRRTSVGPHCNLNIQQVCTSDSDCSGTGDFCVKHLHGPPLPLSAAGVSVCVVNVFSEDVVGISDLATGSSAVRLRQRAMTYLGPTIEGPCPVCGGFCGDPPLGPRNVCSVDADCPAGPLRPNPVSCITAAVCSSGANADQACRPNFPYGGQTSLFGTTSVDCLPDANNVSGPGVDILMNPLTTGAVSLQPTVSCDAAGFGGKTCNGGVNAGANCTIGSECPGGTCSNQCFCPTGGGVAQKPNDCVAACVGGGNDASTCSGNTDCPGGFCHMADCRTNPSDPDGPNEGGCSAGPTDGVCSTHTFQSCSSNSECAAPVCPFCVSGETCVSSQRECFVNSGIIRVGTPEPTNPVTVATFCEAATSSLAVNSVAGLPGPGAIEQPSTITLTGLF